jgi:hypothetical protein
MPKLSFFILSLVEEQPVNTTSVATAIRYGAIFTGCSLIVLLSSLPVNLLR